MTGHEKLTTTAQIIPVLNEMRSEENRNGMARYGINVSNALGIKVTDLRKLARQVATDHDLALKLWDTGIHEARILATLIEDPKRVTRSQADRWARDLDSWDLVDQLCNNLLRKTSFAHQLAGKWTDRNDEFVKRAGYSLIAVLAVHDKDADDKVFKGYLKLVESAAGDDRNFVMKSANWALRQIGKRSEKLWYDAVKTAQRIEKLDGKSARWIARDALRELNKRSPKFKVPGPK
jgi:3-methyladenine DNA glycosylase AlkD